MNQIGSFFEINKENIFPKGKEQYENECFFDPNRAPLRDITHLFQSNEENREYQKKVKISLNKILCNKSSLDHKKFGSSHVKSKIFSAKMIR
jgi:hypothetical protein